MLEANLMTLDSLTSSINDMEARKHLFKKGEILANEFIQKQNK